MDVDPPPIVTRRMILRKLRLSDLTAIARLANYPEIGGFTGFRYPYCILDGRRFLEGIETRGPAHPFENCALCLRSNPRLLIGVAGIGMRSGVWVLGYWMGRAHRGRGYMREAVTALIHAAFKAGVDEIVADALPGNTASLHIIKRVGFKRTGLCSGRSLSKGRKVELIRHRLRGDTTGPRRVIENLGHYEFRLQHTGSASP